MPGVLEGRRLCGDFRWGTSARRTVTLPAMLRCYTQFSALAILLLVAACSTPPRSDAPLLAPAPAQKSAPRPAAPETKLKAGEYEVWVDSDPAGGIVVVNGVPVGRAPQRVVLAGSARGFFRDDVSIKMRFVATDTDHTSQTVEEQLTPLDRIPARLHFTAAGVTRVLR